MIKCSKCNVEIIGSHNCCDYPKQESIEFVPKREAYRFGYYLWIPQWASYDTRPKRISATMFTVLSILPWYTTNPFNGYLVKKNKWTSKIDFSDFIYNPHERTDAILKEELGFK